LSAGLELDNAHWSPIIANHTVNEQMSVGDLKYVARAPSQAWA